jgi:hypothetical protein
MNVQTSSEVAPAPSVPRSRLAPRRRFVLAAVVSLIPITVYAAPRAAGRAAAGTSAAAPAPGNPLAGISRTALDLAPFTGTVEERLPAGGYTYLAVRCEDRSLLWTVTVGPGAKVGERVDVRSFGRQKSFVSARLHRTFPELVFGLVSNRS